MHRIDAETVEERLERAHQADRTAIRVRNDKSVAAVLKIDQPRMVRVHFGNEQRNVFGHAVIARIRNHRIARPRKKRLDLPRRGRIQAREYEIGVEVRRSRHDLHACDARRNSRGPDPVRRVRIPLPGGTRRSGEGRNLEPGMSVKDFNKLLAYRAGSAKDAHPEFFLRHSLCFVRCHSAAAG